MRDAGAAQPAPVPVTPAGECAGAWEDVLESLERDLSTSERLVEQVRRGPGNTQVLEWPARTPWTAPEGLGALTGSLLSRAREIQARQMAVAAAMTEALVEVRALQRRSVRALPGGYPTSGGSASAYVDVEG